VRDNISDVDNIPFSVIAADYYAFFVVEILWLPQFNVLGAPEMAGGSPLFEGVSGIDIGFALSVPFYVKDSGSYAKWAKNLQKRYKDTGSTLTVNELDEFVELARRYGVSVRLDPGHTTKGNPWTMPHLIIGGKNFHIPVPPGYILPP